MLNSLLPFLFLAKHMPRRKKTLPNVDELVVAAFLSDDPKKVVQSFGTLYRKAQTDRFEAYCSLLARDEITVEVTGIDELPVIHLDLYNGKPPWRKDQDVKKASPLGEAPQQATS